MLITTWGSSDTSSVKALPKGHGESIRYTYTRAGTYIPDLNLSPTAEKTLACFLALAGSGKSIRFRPPGRQLSANVVPGPAARLRTHTYYNMMLGKTLLANLIFSSSRPAQATTTDFGISRSFIALSPKQACLCGIASGHSKRSRKHSPLCSCNFSNLVDTSCGGYSRVGCEYLLTLQLA